MVESYLVRNIVYELDLMGINPNNWSDPTLFVFRHNWYVPAATITELLRQSKLALELRKEISDLLSEVEFVDVNPSVLPIPKNSESKTNVPSSQTGDDTSKLFKPYYETAPLDSGLNKPALRRDFKRSHFAGAAYPDKMKAVIGSLNAASRYGHDVGWEELVPFVPERFRNERLPDILVTSGYFYKTGPGRCDIKPKYTAGGVNVS